jgi:hypothetical protein
MLCSVLRPMNELHKSLCCIYSGCILYYICRLKRISSVSIVLMFYTHFFVIHQLYSILSIDVISISCSLKSFMISYSDLRIEINTSFVMLAMVFLTDDTLQRCRSTLTAEHDI